MDETLVLVSAKGLGGTSVVEIEQASGLSPGSGAFYRHFPSKIAAVKAAVEREASRLTKRRSELAAERAGGGDVTAEILADMRLLSEFDSLLAITMRDSKHIPEVAGEIRRLPARGETPVGYDNIIKASERTGRNPQAVSAVVMAASVGFHLIDQLDSGATSGFSREQVAEILADMITSTPSKR